MNIMDPTAGAYEHLVPMGDGAASETVKVLYDSRLYCVSEFSGYDGIEVVDKVVGRSAFLEGAVLARFRAMMIDQMNDDPTDDAVDELLGGFDALLNHPVYRH